MSGLARHPHILGPTPAACHAYGSGQEVVSGLPRLVRQLDGRHVATLALEVSPLGIVLLRFHVASRSPVTSRVQRKR